ncbi:MAG: DUF3558 domain-containing protein [Actinomycetota bacterium]|nr:DUF3558 domain-containing protein [Actinomycetota bacterium]
MALLAGCSGGGGSPASSAAPKERQQLSPPVEHPRDIRAYGDRPCELFTTEQLKGFGFDLPPHRTNNLPSGHKTCAWIDSSRNGELVVSTYPDWDVLERTYAHQAALPVFEPLQIGGTPAVAYQVGAMGTCELTVGLADRQGLDVRFTDLREPYEDPCGAARAAAEVAVGNLPPLG